MLACTAALAGACVADAPRVETVAPAPAFVPQAFFGGETIGEGTLRIALSAPRRTHVVGHGRVEAGDTLVLVQEVQEGARPPRTRTWRIRPIGGGRFTGTLSDAVGPVSAVAHGNLLYIAFTARGGLHVAQWLYLQPGGQVARNRMVVRKLGVRVAVLDETISRR